MDVYCIELLADFGFNTPDFVKNPLQTYGKESYIYLKHRFNSTDNFTVIGTREDKK